MKKLIIMIIGTSFCLLSGSTFCNGATDNQVSQIGTALVPSSYEDTTSTTKPVKSVQTSNNGQGIADVASINIQVSGAEPYLNIQQGIHT